MRRRFFNKIILIATAICFAAVAACDNGYDCELNNTSYDNIGFYTIENGKEVAYTNPQPLTVSLMINGKDSIMINHITDADRVSLPISYTQDCDTVIFHYADEFSDSLYISHTNSLYYQSMECGTLMFHQISDLKHTNTWIENAVIANKDVNFNGNENIKIYFYK